MLADAVDRVKLSRGDRPLIVVGGGSVIVPERLEGVSEIHRPEHHDVANALGAVIAAVSGQVDEVVNYGRDRRAARMTSAALGTPATPLLVSISVNIMTSCWPQLSSMPPACAMKIDASDRYSVVPSRLKL